MLFSEILQRKIDDDVPDIIFLGCVEVCFWFFLFFLCNCAARTKFVAVLRFLTTGTSFPLSLQPHHKFQLKQPRPPIARSCITFPPLHCPFVPHDLMVWFGGGVWRRIYVLENR